MPACGQSSRSALDGDTFPVAIHVLAWHRRVFEGEAHIVRYEQIEVPIAVVVEETASRTPSRLLVPKTGGLGHVGKRSISVVAIETILPKIRAEDVLESVIVVVADTDSGGPSHRLQPGLFRHIGKSTVAVVLEKAIGCARRISVQASPRKKKNSHPPVVVVFDESTATAGRPQNIFLIFNTAVDNRGMQACGRCNVHEMCVERTP